MRKILPILAIALATPAAAQTTTSAVPSAPVPAVVHYTTADTAIGTILDDPAARAIVEKAIPGMTTNPQIDMARGMTLRAVQRYAADQVTDERLAQIDAEFARLPATSK